MKMVPNDTRTELCMRDIDMIGKFVEFHIVSAFIFLGHAPKVWKWQSSASKKWWTLAESFSCQTSIYKTSIEVLCMDVHGGNRLNHDKYPFPIQ